MYAVWKLGWSNLSNKKVQNGFMAVIILLSALLLSTALQVIQNTSREYEGLHAKVHGAHQILRLENGIHDPAQVHQWWAGQKGVTASEMMRYRYLSSMSHAGKEIPNVDLFMMDTPKGPFPVDQLVFVQGEERQAPQPGTVWIPTSLAYSNDIRAGDSVEFKTEKGSFQLQVAAVVVDISYCSPFATSGRIWLNGGDYDVHMSSLQGRDMYMAGLRFEDYSQNRAYWESFEKFLGMPYLESVKDFESLSAYYMIANQLVSFIMVFLAVVMISAALYTLGFTISDAILSSYRTIGIIKSMGLSSRQVIMVYVLQYALLASVAVLPGIGFSYWIANQIVRSSLAYLYTGAGASNVQFLMIALWAGLAVIAAVSLTALLFASRARGIEPAQAIRYGMPEKANARRLGREGGWRKKLHKLGGLPLEWVLGLRSVTANLRPSVLMLLITALSSAVLVFGFVFVHSITSIHGTIAKWGYDSADLSVRIDDPSRLNYERLQEEVLTDERIKNYSRYGDANAVLPIDAELAAEMEQGTMGILLMVAEGNYDEIGYENLRGRNPAAGQEISIGVNIARKLKLDVGDPLDIYIEGEKRTLTVTGIYQAIANMSYTGRITADAVGGASPDFGGRMNTVFINLRAGVPADSFAGELRDRYGSEIWAATQAALVDEVFSQAVAIIILPVSIMALLFVVVTFVMIYSICRIQITKDSRICGIYKSVGMSSGRIRMSLAGGILAVSGLGALAGVPIGWLLLPRLLNVVLADYGMVEVPLIVNAGGIAMMVPISILAAGLGSWLASSRVQKTSPRILTAE